jgi:RNA polymerase-binding transcription factor DksA
MSGRASQHACPRCGRPTPKKRLTETARGRMCLRCVEHLPRGLRKTGEKEARRG